MATANLLDAFLAAIRTEESGGNYTAGAGGSGASGAYQFEQTTWNSWAAAVGETQWVGRPAAAAPPTVQDKVAGAMASSYLAQFGTTPKDAAEAWYYPAWAGQPQYQTSVPYPTAGNSITIGSYGSTVASKVQALLGTAGAQQYAVAGTAAGQAAGQGHGGARQSATGTAVLTAASSTGKTLKTYEGKQAPTGRVGLGPTGTVGATEILLTPSVAGGISATAPSTASYGDNPAGDLATAIRWGGEWLGWGLAETVVFTFGMVCFGAGMILLMMTLFGPTTGEALALFSKSPATRAVGLVTSAASRRSSSGGSSPSGPTSGRSTPRPDRDDRTYQRMSPSHKRRVVRENRTTGSDLF